MLRTIVLIPAAFLFVFTAAARPRPQQFSGAAHSTELPSAVTGDPAATSVPRLVQLNGTLRDSAMRPVAGVVSVTFAIYAEQDGGAALWSETQNVLADAGGHYNVLLGSATAVGVPTELFGTGQSLWLGVTIARQPEQPRALLASVPYALKAGDADTLGGLPASSYVTANQLAARTTTATGGGGATTIITTPQQAQGTQQSASTDAAQSQITQAAVTGTGTTNYIPLWTSGSNLADSILFQTNSRIGVGTTTPVVTLDVNGDSIFRGSFQLVPQGTASASTGQLSHSYQWEASTYNSSTKAPVTTAFGFRATPQGNNTATPTSSLDLYYGPGGGTLTDTGFSFNNAGIVTFVPSQTFNGTGATLNGIDLEPTEANPLPAITFEGTPFIGSGNGSDTFVGTFAGDAATSSASGQNNTGFGSSALQMDSSGSYNVAVGSGALRADSSGANNTAVGDLALLNIVSTSNNTALGYEAGMSTVGSNNTLIGAGADAPGNVLGSTAIGNGAQVTVGSALVLGGVGTYGVDVGIGTSAPISLFDIEAGASSSPTNPHPLVTLTDTAPSAKYSTVAIDFNTSQIQTAGYNPEGRFAFVDQGSDAGAFVFYNNNAGAQNNGLQQTMSINSNGAVQILGNVSIGGTLSKAGGSFKIDDPLAPAEKYLSHSFVESPDMKNIYDGVATLDDHGNATVALPEYFEALNRDYRYTLTAIGVAAPKLHIADEVHGNAFKIAGGKKGMRVSWQVTGIRQDAWANAHRIPNEEEKPAAEQGHYLHPELFGATADKSIESAHTTAATTPTPRGQK